MAHPPDSPFAGSARFIRRESSGLTMYGPFGSFTRITVMTPSLLRSSGPSSSRRPSLSASNGVAFVRRSAFTGANISSAPSALTRGITYTADRSSRCLTAASVA